MTPPTEKGLHAKTSLLSLCLTDNYPLPAVFSCILSFCTFSCFNTKVLIIRLFLAHSFFFCAFPGPIRFCSLLIDVIFHTDIRLHLFGYNLHCAYLFCQLVPHVCASQANSISSPFYDLPYICIMHILACTSKTRCLMNV